MVAFLFEAASSSERGNRHMLWAWLEAPAPAMSCQRTPRSPARTHGRGSRVRGSKYGLPNWRNCGKSESFRLCYIFCYNKYNKFIGRDPSKRVTKQPSNPKGPRSNCFFVFCYFLRGMLFSTIIWRAILRLPSRNMDPGSQATTKKPNGSCRRWSGL